MIDLKNIKVRHLPQGRPFYINNLPAPADGFATLSHRPAACRCYTFYWLDTRRGYSLAGKSRVSHVGFITVSRISGKTIATARRPTNTTETAYRQTIPLQFTFPRLLHMKSSAIAL